MMEISQFQNNAILTISTGELAEKDYFKMLPLMKLNLKKAGKVRWIFQAKNFTKMSTIRFLRLLISQHRNWFEKIAVVGEKGLEKIFHSLSEGSLIEVRHFSLKEAEQARKWIVQ